MNEFSKRVVKWLCAFWFMGGVYGLLTGTYAVYVEITTVDTVFNFLIYYVGAPLLGTVVGYLCKAAFENVKKITKGVNDNADNQAEIEQP